jgi:hypothetical protein
VIGCRGNSGRKEDVYSHYQLGVTVTLGHACIDITYPHWNLSLLWTPLQPHTLFLVPVLKREFCILLYLLRAMLSQVSSDRNISVLILHSYLVVSPWVRYNQDARFTEGGLDLIGECTGSEPTSDGMGTSVTGKLEDGSLKKNNTIIQYHQDEAWNKYCIPKTWR